MFGRSHIEIAHHVACRLPGLIVSAVFADMGAQLCQQQQHAFDAFVARVQHLERRLETGGCGALARPGDGDDATHAGP